MPSAFQDDSREIEIRKLFKLEMPEDRSRHGTDAILRIKGETVEFELKSTREGKSVTTARDVGYEHLAKWKTKHWVVGIYSESCFKYAIYLPPRLLKGWIEKKEKYIRPDYQIANHLHKKISIKEMYELVGKKDIYGYPDAKAIQKEQMSKAKYLALMDLDDGYSPDRMLSIIHDRARYLILRGYTLNNPHIPMSVISAGFKIKGEYPSELRKLLSSEL